MRVQFVLVFNVVLSLLAVHPVLGATDTKLGNIIAVRRLITIGLDECKKTYSTGITGNGLNKGECSVVVNAPPPEVRVWDADTEIRSDETYPDPYFPLPLVHAWLTPMGYHFTYISPIDVEPTWEVAVKAYGALLDKKLPERKFEKRVLVLE